MDLTQKLSTTFLLTIAMLAPTAHSAGAKPFLHPFGEWREYNQAWLSVCPLKLEKQARQDHFYDRHCWAVVESVNDKNSVGFPFYSFRIYRDRVTGRLDIGFTYASSNGDVLDLSRPMIFHIDKSSYRSIRFGSDLRQSETTLNEYLIAEDGLISDLVKDMKDGAIMSVAFPLIRDGKPTEHQVPFSLYGVKASIDFMEEYASAQE